MEGLAVKYLSPEQMKVRTRTALAFCLQIDQINRKNIIDVTYM